MTKTYRAEFFTAADYAVRTVEAETPEEALELARRFYDDDSGELDFRSYDDNAGLDYIQIWDSKRGTLARWETDDCRLRQAAPDLYKALDYFLTSCTTTTAAAVKAISGLPWSRHARRSPRSRQ